jgi:hypothetical protein
LIVSRRPAMRSITLRELQTKGVSALEGGAELI